jgi:nitrogen regulatory protein P-II 1
MKMVEAIVRTERMNSVKESLRKITVGGMTISPVSGWSRQRELHLQWRGKPISYDLIPRIKFEIAVPDDLLDSVIQAITDQARTGDDDGDGVIFVSNIEQAINITTLDKGDKSIS